MCICVCDASTILFLMVGGGGGVLYKERSCQGALILFVLGLWCSSVCLGEGVWAGYFPLVEGGEGQLSHQLWCARSDNKSLHVLLRHVESHNQ